MAEVSIDKQGIDSLAAKLDTLGQDLTDAEKTLLLALFRLAGESLADQAGGDVAGIVSGDTAGVLTLNQGGTLPSLSSGFKDAFSAGGPADLVSEISVDASVSVMGTKLD